jgi:hypothetical protein
MLKHTPGPWRITTDFIGVHDEDGRQIASLDSEGSPEIDEDESLANAYLMAAAPEMLALLKEVLYGLSDRELIDKVFLLIGKARGDETIQTTQTKETSHGNQQG